MNNLDKLIDSICRNFERLLRWVYPGGLFLVLLGLSKHSAFDGLACRNLGIGLWGLIVGGLVAGAIVYLIQAYVVSWIVTFIFILLKWDVRQGLQVDFWPNVPVGKAKTKEKLGEEKKDKKNTIQHLKDCFRQMVDTNPVCCLIPFARVFDRMAEATRKRWSHLDPKGLDNYLNYAWATYHAVFMTGWLAIIFYGINEGNSVFSKTPAYAVLTPAILLLFGGIVYYALLTRIR